MAVIKALIKNVWVQRISLASAGALAGFAYYTFIGCDGGCPLTGNPWTSTAYGALIGYLVHPGRRQAAAATPAVPQPPTSTEH